MKRILSILITLSLLFSLGCTTAAASEKGSFDHFQSVNSAAAVSFTDVSGWYAPYVETVCTLGLMRGSTNSAGDQVFHSKRLISLAETVTLASRIHSTYFNNNAEFPPSGIWYQPYIDYAAAHGILPSADAYKNYTAPATRAEFADILANALPDEAYQKINMIEMGAIPDVSMSDDPFLSIYKLYCAGILTGSDAFGSFRPNGYITRSEVATITSRIVRPNLRQSFNLYAPLYIGYTKSPNNTSDTEITKLTMSTDGTTCYVSMDFKTQSSRFFSVMNSSEDIYILDVIELRPDLNHISFSFPIKTLETICRSSNDPSSEALVMTFYADQSLLSIQAQYYISIDQFSSYFAIH